jgi:hypothetical protein
MILIELALVRVVQPIFKAGHCIFIESNVSQLNLEYYLNILILPRLKVSYRPWRDRFFPGRYHLGLSILSPSVSHNTTFAKLFLPLSLEIDVRVLKLYLPLLPKSC